MGSWLLLLPPEGGARQAATALARAFTEKMPPDLFHTFDSKKYLDAFRTLLKHPDETMATDLLNQSLVVQCLQYAITHVLVPALCPVTLFTLRLLTMQRITTIHWFFEDYRRVTCWKDVAPGYTWFLAVQQGALRRQCETAGCRFAYIPTAASEESRLCTPWRHDRHTKVDVVFIGIPSSYRAGFLEYFLRNNISLAIAGSGWDAYHGPLSESIVKDGWVDVEESLDIMSTAAIALNLSFAEPSGDRWDVQISPRVFDILSCGALLLTEKTPLMAETLGGCYWHAFHNREEALAQCRLILAERNNSGARLMEQSAINRRIIAEKHTWSKRIDQITALCG